MHEGFASTITAITTITTITTTITITVTITIAITKNTGHLVDGVVQHGGRCDPAAWQRRCYPCVAGPHLSSPS